MKQNLLVIGKRLLEIRTSKSLVFQTYDINEDMSCFQISHKREFTASQVNFVQFTAYMRNEQLMVHIFYTRSASTSVTIWTGKLSGDTWTWYCNTLAKQLESKFLLGNWYYGLTKFGISAYDIGNSLEEKIIKPPFHLSNIDMNFFHVSGISHVVVIVLRILDNESYSKLHCLLFQKHDLFLITWFTISINQLPCSVEDIIMHSDSKLSKHIIHYNSFSNDQPVPLSVYLLTSNCHLHRAKGNSLSCVLKLPVGAANLVGVQKNTISGQEENVLVLYYEEKKVLFVNCQHLEIVSEVKFNHSAVIHRPAFSSRLFVYDISLTDRTICTVYPVVKDKANRESARDLTKSLHFKGILLERVTHNWSCSCRGVTSTGSADLPLLSWPSSHLLRPLTSVAIKEQPACFSRPDPAGCVAECKPLGAPMVRTHRSRLIVAQEVDVAPGEGKLWLQVTNRSGFDLVWTSRVEDVSCVGERSRRLLLVSHCSLAALGGTRPVLYLDVNCVRENNDDRKFVCCWSTQISAHDVALGTLDLARVDWAKQDLSQRIVEAVEDHYWLRVTTKRMPVERIASHLTNTLALEPGFVSGYEDWTAVRCQGPLLGYRIRCIVDNRHAARLGIECRSVSALLLFHHLISSLEHDDISLTRIGPDTSLDKSGSAVSCTALDQIASEMHLAAMALEEAYVGALRVATAESCARVREAPSALEASRVLSELRSTLAGASQTLVGELRTQIGTVASRVAIQLDDILLALAVNREFV